MGSPRQIVVDDTDSSIHYGSDWFIADPSTLKGGNFGSIYNGTSHATSSNATLRFPFSGSSITVYGTIDIVTNADNITDPTWSCFLDGIPILNPHPTFKFYENNWRLCQQDQIVPGLHNLTIEVVSKGKTFYLDDLVYTPTPDVSFDSAVVIYPNSDSSVSFGTGWSTFGGENGTQDHGAQVALNFHGTSVSPFGFVPKELPHNATWATFSIDGGSPVNFTLAGLAPSQSAVTEYNVILFTTPTLPSATHDLVIVYGGDGQHTPLVLQGFYVTNTSTATRPSSEGSESSANSSSSSSPAVSPSSTSTASHHSPGGAVAGGVIAGLFLITLLVMIVFWLRRRRRAQDAATQFHATKPSPMPMSHTTHRLPPIAAYSFPGISSSSSGSGRTRRRASTAYPYPNMHRVHEHPASDIPSSSGGMGSPSRTDGATMHKHPQQGSHGLTTTSSSAYPGSSDVLSRTAGGGSQGAVRLGATVPIPELQPPVATSEPTDKLAREWAAAGLPPSSAAHRYLYASNLTSYLDPSTLRVSLQHEDSGVPISTSTAARPHVLELLPGYSAA